MQKCLVKVRIKVYHLELCFHLASNCSSFDLANSLSSKHMGNHQQDHKARQFLHKFLKKEFFCDGFDLFYSCLSVQVCVGCSRFLGCFLSCPGELNLHLLPPLRGPLQTTCMHLPCWSCSLAKKETKINWAQGKHQTVAWIFMESYKT